MSNILQHEKASKMQIHVILTHDRNKYDFLSHIPPLLLLELIFIKKKGIHK